MCSRRHTWAPLAESRGGVGCKGSWRVIMSVGQVWGGVESSGSANAKRVLIVEDNELNMKLFHDLLEAHGYATIETRNGIEALDLARKHRPDLILMDIQLPEVSGLEVTKWLKDDPQLKAIPVVAVPAVAIE